MAHPVIMPRQGNTVETCIISTWHKKKGDRVNAGDVLFTYETDKASFDEEAPVSGILLDVFYNTDDEVPVLTTVCVIGDEGENVSAFAPGGVKKEEAPASESKPEAVKPEPAAVIQPVSSGSESISPRARKLAEKERVDPMLASASGPNGRIIERDVAALAQTGPRGTFAAAGQPAFKGASEQGTGIGGSITETDLRPSSKPTMEAIPSTDGYEEVPLPNIRKVIAKAMQASLANSAQLTLNSSFDATAILDFRAKLKSGKSTADTVNITINDIILFAVSRILKKHRAMNAHFLGDKIRYFEHASLGVAVDTERGLLVPTLRDADKLSLPALSTETKGLIAEAQSGKISPDKLTGATFTITNLGTLGVESFTPVINPPQTGILGVNNITYRQKKTDKGFETYPALGLSLTFDHRALDGAPAARFLKELVEVLENPVLLLV